MCKFKCLTDLAIRICNPNVSPHLHDMPFSATYLFMSDVGTSGIVFKVLSFRQSSLSSLLRQAHIHFLFLNEYTLVSFLSWSNLVFLIQDAVGFHFFGNDNKGPINPCNVPSISLFFISRIPWILTLPLYSLNMHHNIVIMLVLPCPPCLTDNQPYQPH